MPRLKAPQRRQQLIDVATKLFARWGYNATTTAAIAEIAGVTEPILYRHFVSKQELFVAITRATSEKTLKHWNELIRGVSGSTEKLRTIASEFPSHIRKLEDAYQVIHGALISSHDRKVQNVLREHYSQIERFFHKIIAEGQSSGEFRRNVDPNLPVWQLINTGMSYAMIVLNLKGFDRFSAEDNVEYILRGLKD